MREMQWVTPVLAQIRFVEWTAEGRLRHAAFLGLRSDKSAREVRRDANSTGPSAALSARSGRLAFRQTETKQAQAEKAERAGSGNRYRSRPRTAD